LLFNSAIEDFGFRFVKEFLIIVGYLIGLAPGSFDLNCLYAYLTGAAVAHDSCRGDSDDDGS